MSSDNEHEEPTPTPSEQLAQSTSTLLHALPSYLTPTIHLVTPSDLEDEDALVKVGRHKHGPASRAAGMVKRLMPIADAALGVEDEEEGGSGSASGRSEPVVAALNALALVFSITTRHDDALEQLEKIAYQASRLQDLAPAQLDELVRDASRTLLAAVLTFLRGALRKPGVSARRVPMGAAQMYAAGKQRLNGAIAAYDAVLHQHEQEDEEGDQDEE
ncbi:hypothetical protein EXIGLDRAFT_771256 [Exidia glandulosa HHB12029]|uniref:Uncharacterized protein n=1 Tax=Exidia glandulosa HHB12029 TaxID=1314781 RepID=A0A165G4I6_EXIGL|nr:hypothetical protein EXIGLDRAFT_771256 [Exidia glandulosa HHB12029]